MNKEEMFDALMKYSDNVRIIFRDNQGNKPAENEYNKRMDKASALTQQLSNWKENEIPYQDEWLDCTKKVLDSGTAMEFVLHFESDGVVSLHKALFFPVKNKEGKTLGLGSIIKKL